MKKNICILLLCITAVLVFSGCQNQKQNNVSAVLQPSVNPNLSSKENQDNESSDEESYESLPKRVERKDKDTLKYKIESSAYTVFFPDLFFIQDSDYKPERGIYLQNDEGTATLIIEAVEDNIVDNEQLNAYLRGKYPETEISNDESCVVLTKESEDLNGNHFILIQKMQTNENGYIIAAVSCKKEVSENYKKLIDHIYIKNESLSSNNSGSSDL